MAENSLKEWLVTLLDTKKTLKKAHLLSNEPSNLIKKASSDHILFLSDVDGLGDAIMFRGVIQAFIDNGYHVSLVTRKYHIDAYNGLLIDNIFLWDYVDKILSQEFKYVICHHFNARSYQTALTIKATEKYIVNFSEQLTNIIVVNAGLKKRNIWDIYNNFLDFFDFRYELVDFPIDSERNEKIEKYNDDYIIIHIGSGSLCKNWGIDNFIKLSNELTKMNLKHVFIAGPFERKVLEGYFLDNLISNLTFLELVELIRNARLVICHGTSILHLSVTLDTKTISINSTYDFHFWHPYKDMDTYRDKHIALTSMTSTNCNKYKRLFHFSSGLNKNGCPILKNEIDVKDIINKIKGLKYDNV